MVVVCLLEYYGMLICAISTLTSPHGGFACRGSAARQVSGKGFVQALGLYIKSGPLLWGRDLYMEVYYGILSILVISSLFSQMPYSAPSSQKNSACVLPLKSVTHQ